MILSRDRLSDKFTPGIKPATSSGSSVVMSDTASNQKEYPQHSNQKSGCGFPIAKIVVMFSLSTASAIGIRIAALNTGEVTLARSLYETLEPNDLARRGPSLWNLCRSSFSPTKRSRWGITLRTNLAKVISNGVNASAKGTT